MLTKAILLVCIVLFHHGRCVDIDKHYFEHVLIREHHLDEVEKVTSINSKHADDFYAPGSENRRILMDVVLNDGAHSKKSLLLKTLPSTPAYHKQIEESGIFKNEVLIYRDVLSIMEKVLHGLNDHGEVPWVRALDLKDFDSIVLEDATEQLGYKTGNRWKGLTLAQSIMVMQALAKFHALSILANDEHNISDEFELSIVEKNYEQLKDFYEVLFEKFAHIMEENWGKEWSHAVKKIRDVAPHVKDKLKKLYIEKGKFINALNVGSPNSRTSFFKYGISDFYSSEKPLAVKLSYFQLGYFNSPIHDIQYFINTSPSLEVMTKHRTDLLSEYYTSLLHYLKSYKYKGPLPTHDQFVSEVKRTDFEGITLAIQILPIIFEKEKPKLEHLEHYAEENMNSNSTVLDVSGMHTKEFEKVIKVLLKIAIDSKVL